VQIKQEREDAVKKHKLCTSRKKKKKFKTMGRHRTNEVKKSYFIFDNSIIAINK
jgi:hypothetical protein